MQASRIAVIGSGLMGHGIAQVIASTGLEVSLIDVKEEFLLRALSKVAESLRKLSEKGTLKETPEAVLKRIKTTTDLRAGVAGADFVIEAVFEDINLKRSVIREADACTGPSAILATNTTGLSIAAIADGARRKERVIGMHWMNPPQLVKLVEIIIGKYTGDEALEAALGLCALCRKEPVIAKRDVWQFLAARARAGFSIESNLAFLRKEAEVPEIDAVARYKLGIPMGEFELMDFTGAVDIRSRGLESVKEIVKTNADFEPWSALLAAYSYLARELWLPMNEKGLHGLKAGKGFYEYPGGRYAKPQIARELAGKIDPIQLLAPAINAAAWCVTNGVGTIDDVNKCFKLAFGWPRGIFEFVDDYGVARLIEVLEAKQDEAPAEVRSFYDADPLLTNWRA